LNKKVSVIVPIYKVESYLKRCIESILKQTYKQLEIILVDDGSPDSCGDIAEQYAKEDSRIKVLHKENGGLSDARNFGMKYVNGEYVIFVDSDDWLAPNLVEKLIKAMIKYQADLVQTAFYYAHDDYLQFDNRVYNVEESPAVFDNQTLMKELVVNEKVKNFAWGKIYRTSLIKDIPFKKGVLFEDVFWAHKVMMRVNKFVLLNEPLYFYYQRNDSIVANYTPRNLDIINGLLERHHFILENYKELEDESNKMILKTLLIHYNLLLRNRKKDKKGTYRKNISHYVKRHYKEFNKAVRSENHLKKQLSLFRIHPYFNLGYLLIHKALRNLNGYQQPTGLERIEVI
jgi:glycosyltransferase involved in cell wall biosynthesis